MPLQNRVDPFGNLFRSTAHGTMMGNCGGAIHNESREIVRRYKSRRWIACILEFRGRHRVVMSPNRYTELFFLDEATAFAAGHRPCAECRRERYNAFRAAWHTPAFADDIDRELHPARIDLHSGAPHKRKVTYEAELRTLPNGTFIEREGKAYLVRGGKLLQWAPEGYTERIPRPNSQRVTVLTPKPIVECFRHGYRPAVHDSAR